MIMYQLDIIENGQKYQGSTDYYDLFNFIFHFHMFIYSTLQVIYWFFSHPLTSNFQLNCKFLLECSQLFENQKYFWKSEIKLEKGLHCL